MSVCGEGLGGGGGGVEEVHHVESTDVAMTVGESSPCIFFSICISQIHKRSC